MGDLVKEKSQSIMRWPILLFCCLMMIGNYYCYDIPAALHTQMYDFFEKPSDFEALFALLYTVYSVPNIILPVSETRFKMCIEALYKAMLFKPTAFYKRTCS